MTNSSPWPIRGIMLVAMRVDHLPEAQWPWVNLLHIAAVVPVTSEQTEIRFTGGGTVNVSLSAEDVLDVMQEAAARM
jgi:hypothetical protein